MVSISQLLQRTGDGLVVVDEHQRIVSWNKAATSILGLSEQQAIGRPCYEVLQCYDKDGKPLCERNCSIFGALSGGQELSSHEMLLRQDGGQYVRCNLSFLAIDDPERMVRAAFLIRPREATGMERSIDEELIPPAELVVRCLGSFEVWASGTRLVGPPISRKKAGRALRLLVHRRGERVSRDQLVDVLWPDATPEAARASLKVLIHTLRRALEPGLGPTQESRFIGYENDCYFFTNSTNCWVDADAFLDHGRKGQLQQAQGATDEAQAHYLAAVRLYRGDYLTEDLYEDWCAGERERLRATHASIIMALAAIRASQQDYTQAVDYCWQALADDGCREIVYRHLMDYLRRDGRPDEAIHVFHRCEDMLRQELDLAPLPETVDLFRQIKADLDQARAVGHRV